MMKKFSFGAPVYTGAVEADFPAETGDVPFGTLVQKWPLKWEFHLEKHDIVYGLGESVRGMNKRGFRYVSWCSDVPNQHENTPSMYGAHNFLLVFGKKIFGIFFDTASEITFDVGWEDCDRLTVTTEATGADVYFFTADDKGRSPSEQLRGIVKEFRALIGQSYIPPRWAFGLQQSRWGYRTEDDVRAVVKGYRSLGLPLDSVCLDIDYMTDYEDFTVDEKKFPDFSSLNKELSAQGIHLVPIIDAGVKAREGYSVYEEGMRGGYFVTKEDGSVFTAGVWPGKSHFTDFFKDEARAWFGEKYRALTEQGIEGVWNDMNEPAMFYSEESLKSAFERIKAFEGKNLDINTFFEFSDLAGSTFNRRDDYECFYHEIPHRPDGHKASGKIRHDKIHNIYGAWMTRAAWEGLSRISPERRMLIYSRASCIGAHRYGGIWQGDNASTWAHLLMEIKMMPGLNMCGFLYNGADIGGFGGDASRDLVMRWLSFGVFTPLMRNHAAWNTREQECYAFKNPEGFKSILDLRYALIPYLYSEFIKCAVSGEMLMRPLSFDFDDETGRAGGTEDQLMVGEGIMIAPVYTQNARGRLVYLPEDMTMVRWENSMPSCTEMPAGDHYIDIPEEVVVFFIKHGKCVPLARPGLCTKDVSAKEMCLLGTGTEYALYDDDGYTRNIDLTNVSLLKKN
ncbi:MAG: alpha-glucosidase [Treponema sp.]|nr:alpha-glucosidase [Treponema sp.]